MEAARGHMAAMVEQDAAQASDVITFTSGGTEVRLMLKMFLKPVCFSYRLKTSLFDAHFFPLKINSALHFARRTLRHVNDVTASVRALHL